MDPRIKDAQNDFQKLANCLLSLSAEELTLLTFSIAYTVSIPLTTDQQSTIGNTFILFGQVLLSMNAQRNYLSDITNKVLGSQSRMDDIMRNFRP